MTAVAAAPRDDEVPQAVRQESMTARVMRDVPREYSLSTGRAPTRTYVSKALTRVLLEEPCALPW